MINREAVFIGVDLGTSTRRKSTGIAYLVERNGKPWIESPPVHILSKDKNIRECLFQISENFSSKIIGIDAPLSRPEKGNWRKCEIELRHRYRIACYPSGVKVRWTYEWVEKGIELQKWAKSELNARVIEVYPYAARVMLNIGAKEKKKTMAGRKVIQAGLLHLISGLDKIIGEGCLSTDELDAILSAYTAYCEEKNLTEKIDCKDGEIYLPLKRQDHRIDEY